VPAPGSSPRRRCRAESLEAAIDVDANVTVIGSTSEEEISPAADAVGQTEERTEGVEG